MHPIENEYAVCMCFCGCVCVKRVWETAWKVPQDLDCPIKDYTNHMPLRQ